MNARELIVLCPYQLPAQNAAMFANEDVECVLNAYSALWHPAALRGAIAPPRIASPYDFEQPSGNHLYAVPESPPLMLPDDWDQRVADAGAIVFRSTTSREGTLANFQEAMKRAESPGSPEQKVESREPESQAESGESRAESQRGVESAESRVESQASGMPGAEGNETLSASGPSPSTLGSSPALDSPPSAFDSRLLELPLEKITPFFGIGFGFLMMNLLFEAMEHENLVPPNEIWQEVQEAIEGLLGPDPDSCRAHLQAAAEKLASARDVLYTAPIHILDIAMLDEGRLGEPLPAAFEKGLPFNLIASGSLLEKLSREQPDKLAAIRERVQSELVEVAGGDYLEREDALLPVESQLWNLLKGLAVSKQLLGAEVRVFARKRFAAHPQLPLLLNQVGLQRCILLAFDAAVVPTYRSPVISWPSPDGKQVDAFTRTPHHVDNPQTFFHFAHYLKQTLMQDHSATFALLHGANPPAPWYDDLIELTRLAPALGQWCTLSKYFSDVSAGEYVSAVSAEEFHSDYLEERTNAHLEQPASWFARQVRQRRQIDTAWTFAGLFRSLAGPPRTEGDEKWFAFQKRLAELEDRFESGGDPGPDLEALPRESADMLAGRLLSRGKENNPGYLVLNPCSYARRVVLEIDGLAGPLPIDGPIKAAQFDAERGRLVVEVPALGFAWFPKSGPPGTRPPPSRMVLADKHCVRNEFFEAEVDPVTGGLRALRDHRNRINRIGQQLVFNPGSIAKVTEIKTTSTGPALGEIISEGVLLDEQAKVLAKFRQRFRAWLSRPLLDLRIEIFPEHTPQGYPWHNYYGARFAWRDERAVMLRGVNGTSYITTQTRPETPDYLELRSGKQATTLFPGGLPFHQRHGGRMLDVILLAEGESAHSFDLGLALDREHPMHTAVGMVSPAPVLLTDRGPPHVGNAGWLFHLDATNLLLSTLRPAADGAHAVTARLLECRAHSGQAAFRCVRDPKRAELLDAKGGSVMNAVTEGDSVLFDVSAGDLVQLRFDFAD